MLNTPAPSIVHEYSMNERRASTEVTTLINDTERSSRRYSELSAERIIYIVEKETAKITDSIILDFALRRRNFVECLYERLLQRIKVAICIGDDTNSAFAADAYRPK